VATNGIITTVAGNGSSGYAGDGVAATSTPLNNPHGVTVDSAGNLFIADSANNRIRKVAIQDDIGYALYIAQLGETSVRDKLCTVSALG
jgi:DNA-binding beta-propeller fold protein YncE